MPKMFVQSSKGTFTASTRAGAGAARTELSMRCERLADTDRVRSGVQVSFSEAEADALASGGTIARTPLIVLIVYALEGSLDDAGRTTLAGEATAILRRCTPPPGHAASMALERIGRDKVHRCRAQCPPPLLSQSWPTRSTPPAIGRIDNALVQHSRSQMSQRERRRVAAQTTHVP